MTAPALEKQKIVYSLTGTLLEACSCGVLCPCWVGEDPDMGECLASLSYNFKEGEINGVNVSGLNMVFIAHIPGNVLVPQSWKVALFTDSRATPEQHQALVDAFTGKLGGPLADLAGLVGEVVSIEQREITHDVVGGKGTLNIPGIIEAEMEPYRGGDGTITSLRDTIFSTVPGSPAYASKASKFKVDLPQHGMQWEFSGRNAIQSDYMMVFQQ